MIGREFVRALETQGFVVRRRCKSFVWLSRGEQSLMVDEDAIIPQGFLDGVLGRRSHPPPSAVGLRPSRPSSLGSLGRSPRPVPKA